MTITMEELQRIMREAGVPEAYRLTIVLALIIREREKTDEYLRSLCRSS